MLFAAQTAWNTIKVLILNRLCDKRSSAVEIVFTDPLPE
jgi:hypothetical protein